MDMPLSLILEWYYGCCQFCYWICNLLRLCSFCFHDLLLELLVVMSLAKHIQGILKTKRQIWVSTTISKVVNIHSCKLITQFVYPNFFSLKSTDRFLYISCSIIVDFLPYIYCRHLLGEDLGPLNIKDLEHLELQLDSSLKHIRSTKVNKLQFQGVLLNCEQGGHVI